MEPQKTVPPVGLTFDDVLLLPNYSDFSREDINLSTYFSRRIKLEVPFSSAPMDTVTESRLAISLARLGGIGVIHRNMTIETQTKEVLKVKSKGLLVGAAVGASKSFEKRAEALIKAGVDVIVVDSAHGFSKKVIDAVSFIKKNYKKIDVVGGNIATADGAKALIKAGVDGLRVGMGPGAICTTRVISGMGVPQITALLEVGKVARKTLIPVIADGGIRYSGDIVKALAAGASSAMMGSFFASSVESPGKKVLLRKEQVPHRFQSVFNTRHKTFHFKEYRGMGSSSSMKKGARVKAEDEFHGKDYEDRVLVVEGVEGLVPIKGKVEELLEQAIGGLKSGMYYIGAKNLNELWDKARFTQITPSSLQESHPHSLLITNSGKNYL